MEDQHESCASDEDIAADVEQYGLSIVAVRAEENNPRFAYSVGLYQRFHHPEIILFGLNEDLACWILNELANQIEAGTSYAPDQEYEGLLEGYNCVFREVPKGCYSDYFGAALRFYQHADFPALQLIWPDKAGKWPWELEFNHYWLAQQPLLEYWPDEKAKSFWEFDEPRNLGVFTTTKVLDENHPILRVYHDADGDWQFLCATTNDPKDGRLVCLNEIVSQDPSVAELADLPEGWVAWRANQDAKWQREPLQASEE